MIFDYSLAAIVSAGLLFYLTYALLRPERFWSLKGLPRIWSGSGPVYRKKSRET